VKSEIAGVLSTKNYASLTIY